MNVAFVSYETPFAPCGGIAAVMGRLPAQVKALSRRETVVVTPYHQQMEKTTRLPRNHVGDVGVSLAGRTVPVHILRYDDKVPHFFLQPEDSRFFNGARHPYDMPAADLLRDSLFFGQAVIRALPVISPGARWTLLLQDWEAATAVLAASDRLAAFRSFITLHNSYDCSVSATDLQQAGINANFCPGSTVLQRALPLSARTVFTVSEQFAFDFTEDMLQTKVMATHLQTMLRPRLIGIDNGPFVELAVDPDVLAQAAAGQPERLRRWKEENRALFLSALTRYQPTPDRPLWGEIEQFERDDAPWIVMAGRDDCRQKGYDVAAQAAQLFLEQGGQARFLFFPIPGDEGLAGLRFLEQLAQRFPQHVLVFPFLFREGFLAALRGATYGLMPSLYEPFGMANEFYLNGTVGIGRATGGIVQQIVPLRSAASHSRAVQHLASRWHAPSSIPTGILFREKQGLPTEAGDWASLNAAKYSLEEAGPNRVQERLKYTLFQSMVDELRLALGDATRIYRQQPHIYYRLLANGIAHIQQSFSWDRASAEYLRYIG